MKKLVIRNFSVIALLIVFMLPNKTYAHALSAAFTNINLSTNQTELIYSIDSLSVIEGIGGDQDDDGILSESELEGINHRVEEWIEDSVVLEVDGKEQAGELTSLKLEQKNDKQMVTFQFTYPGYEVGKTVKLLDGIFYEGQNNSSYNNFLAVSYDGQVSEAVLHGKNREWAMRLTETQQQQQDSQIGQSSNHTEESSSHSSWTSFFTLGMEHILTGYDHLLFLFALLLRKQTLRQYIFTITAFTIAHSITLTLSVLGIVELPSKFVESIIALSICYVALENIFRKEIKLRWLITFIFGLIHGLGFASILKEMNLPKSDLVTALFNFNIGIECIQLIIVLLLVPVLFKLQKLTKYRAYVNIGSSLIFLLGAIWLVQRILG